MTNEMFEQIKPERFSAVTHSIFVTVNGNEEYDCATFTMTGQSKIHLLINIAVHTLKIVSEQFDDIYADDILIDIYHYESDDVDAYSVLDQRTNLAELSDFLLSLGIGHIGHEIDYFFMEYDKKFPEPDFVGECNDASFDPDRSTIGR